MGQMARQAMNSARVDVDLGAVPGLPDTGLRIAADIFWPASLRIAPAVLFCFPGGGVQRRYFDMRPGGDDGFSFARALTAQGHVVVTIDHLGVGESSRPADGFALTADVLAAANAVAVASISGLLRAGKAAPGLRALQDFTPIGVGHSMGAMLVTLQQIASPACAGLALLCFATRGLPQYMADVERENLTRPNMGRDAYPALAATRFGGDPYPPVARGRAGSAASDAVAEVQAGVLATAAFQSMMPGSIAPEAAALRTRLFLAAGDRDMTGPPHEIPASFPGCTDIRLVVIENSGHHPFVSPNRDVLFHRLGAWAAELRDETGAASWRN